MVHPPAPRVKICCIASPAEAELAIEMGAYALGLVGPMPSGPGVIPLDRMAEIRSVVPEAIETFFLTSKTTAKGILEEYKYAGTSAIQLTDYVNTPVYEEVRNALPGIKLVQVVHVIDDRDVERSVSLSGHVDMLLLDSGRPGAALKTLGGTGNTHDWEISRRIVEGVDVPVFLAGGLNPGNVRDAVETVRPFGLDVCSGLRTNGVLDRAKVEGFFKNILPGQG